MTCEKEGAGRLALISLCVFWILAALPLQLRSEPIPDAFGVYAVVGNSLVELHGINKTEDTGFAGMDLLRSPRYVTLPSGRAKFMIFAGNATDQMQLTARRLARVESSETVDFAGNFIGDRKKLDNFWLPSRDAELLKVSPMDQKPQMMIRVVPTGELARGVWVLEFHHKLYPFAVGKDAEQQSECLVRKASVSLQVSYAKCSANVNDGTKRAQDVEAGPRSSKRQVAEERPIGASASPQPSTEEKCGKRGTATIAVKYAALKEKPDFRANTKRFLDEGLEVLILGVLKDGYCEVELDGIRGWVNPVSLTRKE